MKPLHLVFLFAVTISLLLLTYTILFENSIKTQDVEEEEVVFVPNIDLQKDDIVISNTLGGRILDRIKAIEKENIEKGYPLHFRGISWVYKNLDGLLIGAPEFEEQYKSGDVFNSDVIEIVFKDVSKEQKCISAKANLVSIWVRLAGPEVIYSSAEPVIGECKWIAKFNINIPGRYTAYARLLHFNGNQDRKDKFSTVAQKNEKNIYLEVLHEIPRYPYYNSPDDCSKMCSRFKDCQFSLHSPSVPEFKNYGLASRCTLFKNSTEKEGVRADLLREKILIYSQEEKQKLNEERYVYVESLLNENPYGTIWQLGCGRDEMLMRYAPCSSIGAPIGSTMSGVEDVILFEHEHSGMIVVPSVQRLATLAVDEWLASSQEISYKPTCSWSNYRLPHFEQGRWIVIPTSRLEHCGPLPAFEGVNIFPAPKYTIDDPLCFSRFHLDALNQFEMRWKMNYTDYSRISEHMKLAKFRDWGYVWKSELSDNYYLLNNAKIKVNRPLVQGPFAAFYQLPASSICRIPPHRKIKQIRECFEQQNVIEILTHGASIREFLGHYLNTYFKATFSPTEYTYDGMKFKFNLSKKPESKNSTRVFLSTFAAPHVMSRITIAELESDLRKAVVNTVRNDAYKVKIYVTPSFSAWERRQYCTSTNAAYFRNVLRKAFPDWYEVDYFSLSAALTFDATIERDSLHVIAQPMVAAAQMVIDIVCSASR